MKTSTVFHEQTASGVGGGAEGRDAENNFRSQVEDKVRRAGVNQDSSPSIQPTEETSSQPSAQVIARTLNSDTRVPERIHTEQ